MARHAFGRRVLATPGSVRPSGRDDDAAVLPALVLDLHHATCGRSRRCARHACRRTAEGRPARRRRRSASAAGARCRAAGPPTSCAPGLDRRPAPPRPPTRCAPDGRPRSARSGRPRWLLRRRVGQVEVQPRAIRADRPPVTAAPLIRLHSRCIAVCMRISRWRRSQSISRLHRRADRRKRRALCGKMQDRLALALHRVGDRASRRRPSAARRHRPAGRRERA